MKVEEIPNDPHDIRCTCDACVNARQSVALQDDHVQQKYADRAQWEKSR